MTSVLSRRTAMKAAAICTGAALLPQPRTVEASDAGDPTFGRKLVFDENFAMLDPDVWFAGPKATTFDGGFYGRSAFSRISGEEGIIPYAIVDDGKAEDGKALEISAHYVGRKMSVPNYYGNDLPEYQWISGNIQTARRDGTIMKGWRNGYFEARMHMPSHPLSFPAFWLMNGRSILYPQTSTELDVVEHKGWENRLYGTYLHEWGEPGKHNEGAGVATQPDLTTGYFRYGMLVDGDRVTSYFERQPAIDVANGKPIAWTIERVEQLDTHNDVFWPLLTLALRDDVKFPQPLSEGDRKTRLLIDYFRVYASDGG